MGSIQSVKGTRDFYPQDMSFRTWLYQQIRQVSEKYGYEEYEAPFLEKLELYAAKSGDELVKEQSFVFPDRGGEMIALRPELTPSLARMVAARSRALPRPIRWWSFGPFWRYERPQRGRSREFFQWNIDLLGIESPETDAELATIAASFLDSVGLSAQQVQILVNDRRLADSQLQALGVPQDRRADLFRLIDRRERMSERKWRAYVLESGATEDLLNALQAILDDREAWKTSAELQDFFQAAEAMGFARYLAYDPGVIRGLDYYTGTVFEARDASGEFRAILGGGRYDDLVAAVGGDPVPGVGFAMGDMVLRLVLEKYEAEPDLRSSTAQVLVVTFDESSQSAALMLAAGLRAQGIRTEWYPQADRIAKQLKFADKQGIPLVAILGPDEIRADTVSLKDLRTGDQVQISRGEIATRILQLLRTGE